MVIDTAIATILKSDSNKLHPWIDYDLKETPKPQRIQQPDISPYCPWEGGYLNKNFSTYKELCDRKVLEFYLESESPEMWLPQLLRSQIRTLEPTLTAAAVEKKAASAEGGFSPDNFTFLPINRIYAIGLKKVCLHVGWGGSLSVQLTVTE